MKLNANDWTKLQIPLLALAVMFALLIRQEEVFMRRI